MLTDIAELDGRERHADIAVIGTGIAGAELGTYLAARGHDVILLESGREDFDPAIQKLNDIDFIGKPHRALDPNAGYHPYLPPELRGVSRVRQLGGTSNVWTGKWKHLQRTDFGGRPWVPDSDWPFGLDELLPHYREAARDYGFGDLEAEAERSGVKALRDALRGEVKATSFYWEATPTRTRIRFGEVMRRSARLQVITGATATRIDTTPDGTAVAGVSCRSLDGHVLTVRARIVVLATGAIEAPRLLLASSSEAHPAGLGNAAGLVGRYYADHPKHHTSDLDPGPLTRAYADELQYAPKPRFCLCFALDDDTQRKERLLEHVLYLKPIYETRRDRLGRWLRRRPACRDGLGAVRSYRVKLVTEQVPNPDSRVTLSDALDPLGVPVARLDWRFTPDDHRSLARVTTLLAERFERLGVGSLRLKDDPPTLDAMTDAAHQMGTTRMGRTPAEGVVNADGQVFGVDGLFVAGSATFPTCPSYSPTFTILALARRLGRHLDDSLAARGRQPVAEGASA